MTLKNWEEDLKLLIPEKTDNVIIHGYRQLTRGKIKDFISSLLTQAVQEERDRIKKQLPIRTRPKNIGNTPEEKAYDDGLEDGWQCAQDRFEEILNKE